MNNVLLSTSSTNEIREYLGCADEVELSDLIDAVMILCRRVEGLEAVCMIQSRRISALEANPNA